MEKSYCPRFDLALIICLFFVAFFTGIFLFNGTLRGDWPVALEMARTQIAGNYPPVYSWLSAPFAFNEKTFYLFGIFLIALIIPLALYFVAKDWLVVLFYFATGFVWRIEGFGALAMALGGFAFILFLFDRRFFVRLVLLVVSLLIHGSLFFLLLGTWLILAFFELFKQKGLALSFLCGNPKNFFDGMNFYTLTGKKVLVDSGFASVGFVLRFFLSDFNLAFLFAAVKGLRKEPAVLLVGAFIVFSSFFIYNRALYILPLALLVGTVRGVRTFGKKEQEAFVLIGVCFVLVNFIQWFFELNSWCL